MFDGCSALRTSSGTQGTGEQQIAVFTMLKWRSDMPNIGGTTNALPARKVILVEARADRRSLPSYVFQNLRRHLRKPRCSIATFRPQAASEAPVSPAQADVSPKAYAYAGAREAPDKPERRVQCAALSTPSAYRLKRNTAPARRIVLTCGCARAFRDADRVRPRGGQLQDIASLSELLNVSGAGESQLATLTERTVRLEELPDNANDHGILIAGQGADN